LTIIVSKENAFGEFMVNKVAFNFMQEKSCHEFSNFG